MWVCVFLHGRAAKETVDQSFKVFGGNNHAWLLDIILNSNHLAVRREGPWLIGVCAPLTNGGFISQKI